MRKSSKASRRRPRQTELEWLEGRQLLAASAGIEDALQSVSAGEFVQAAALGSHLLIVTRDADGSERLSDYDPATNASAAVAFSGAAGSVATVGNVAVFAGGYQSHAGRATASGVDDVAIYDASTAQVTAGHLSQARGNIAAVTVGGKTLFAGGDLYNRPRGVGVGRSDQADVYDPATQQWSTSTMPRAGGSLRAAVVGDKAIFAAGANPLDGGGTLGGVTETYDATTGLWSTAPMSVPRFSVAAAAVGQYALFAGGVATAGPSDAVDVYDDSTGQWTTAHLSVARQDVTAVTVGSLAIFAGGWYQSTGGRLRASRVVDVFDSATGQWSTGTLAEPLAGPAYAGVAGGRAVFIPSRMLTVVAQTYDPAAGRGEAVRLAGLPTFNPLGGIVTIPGAATGDETAYLPYTDRELVSTGYVAHTALDVILPTTAAAPGNPSPGNGAARDGSGPIHFTWSPTVGATSYDLYVDDILIGQNLTATRDTLPTLAGHGRHTWQVVAHVPGAAISSDRWSFTLRQPLLVAGLSAPAAQEGATVSPSTRFTANVTVRNVGELAGPGPFRVTVYASSSRPALKALEDATGMVPIGSAILSSSVAAGASVAVDVPVSLASLAGVNVSAPLTFVAVVRRYVRRNHIASRVVVATSPGGPTVLFTPGPANEAKRTPGGAATAGARVI